ncbi:MAG: site-2 protease family protein [Thermodesulfobacteriota bacterium]
MLEFLQKILLMAPPLLLALTAHECAHAWVASRLGDPTAKMMGRITLNPIKHLDPLGTLALFLSGMFGWAKPVPVNPRHFKDPAKGMMYVSLAGPATNLFLAAVFTLVYKLLIALAPPAGVEVSGLYDPLFRMVVIGIYMNVALAVFNMIPVPPLDGSKVLASFLPPDKALAFSRIEPYGFLILLTLIFTGVIHAVFYPIVMVAFNFLTGGVI